MAIGEGELGARLRRAREACEWTHVEVAEVLGVPWTDVARIESGERRVSSVVFEQLAHLYARSMGAFFSKEGFSESPVTELFQSGVAEDRVLKEDLPRIVGLCIEAVNLERLLGLNPPRSPRAQYDLPSPRSASDAIMQGREIAQLEHRRLGLGDAPVTEITRISAGQGIRVAEAKLAREVSGVFVRGEETGLVIIVNEHLNTGQKVSACAHEYGHALVHLGNSVNVCRAGERVEFSEVRADAFAATFVAPYSEVTGDLDRHWMVEEQVLELGLGAYRHGLVSRRKLLHVARQAGISAERVEGILDAEGLHEEPVEPMIPA